jgi:hypothetical protein
MKYMLIAFTRHGERVYYGPFGSRKEAIAYVESVKMHSTWRTIVSNVQVERLNEPENNTK